MSYVENSQFRPFACISLRELLLWDWVKETLALEIVIRDGAVFVRKASELLKFYLLSDQILDLRELSDWNYDYLFVILLALWQFRADIHNA